ncbi:hypothetical protein AK812_SmicGene231 [Symbiodinium microadriaticum]|uniref:Uncharacterized protein n=1 Tax=Symbiodinium microadriaticum TaxID=2951 RepID=A0A1Q9F743_SYMMI|nr:hypothetical protein AK812_SmicGene231 [Symbiodinium microadriaticum]
MYIVFYLSKEAEVDLSKFAAKWFWKPRLPKTVCRSWGDLNFDPGCLARAPHPPPPPANSGAPPFKEVVQAAPAPANNLNKKVVDRDHSPARFHHEDQRQALSKEMKESAQQVFDGWGSTKRMSTVMAAMEELPKRVGEDMHKMVSHVVDSVQTEINEDEKVTGSTKVVRHLEVIPTMVVNLLESRVEKAKAEVKKKVGGMILQLTEIQETNENDEELAEQMQVMSSEVAQIAGAAVEAATQVLANLVENQDGDENKAPQHVDRVAHEAANFDLEEGNAVEEDLLIQKPLADSFPSVQSSAMENAVAVIKVTNEIVADQLLRAKVRSRGDVQPPGSVMSSGTEEALDIRSYAHDRAFTFAAAAAEAGKFYADGFPGGESETLVAFKSSSRFWQLHLRLQVRLLPYASFQGLVPIIRTKILTITAPLVILGSVCEAPVSEEGHVFVIVVRPENLKSHPTASGADSKAMRPRGLTTWFDGRHLQTDRNALEQRLRRAVTHSSTVERLDQMRLRGKSFQCQPSTVWAIDISCKLDKQPQDLIAVEGVSDVGHESYKAWFRGLSFMMPGDNFSEIIPEFAFFARDDSAVRSSSLADY